MHKKTSGHSSWRFFTLPCIDYLQGAPIGPFAVSRLGLEKHKKTASQGEAVDEILALAFFNDGKSVVPIYLQIRAFSLPCDHKVGNDEGDAV